MNLRAATQSLMGRPWVEFPVTVLRRFGEDNCSLIAAGLAFFTVLSFAPLLLTAVAALAFLIHNPAQAALSVEAFAQGMFPTGGAQREIGHLLGQRVRLGDQVDALVRGRALAVVIGLVTLVWTSVQIFVNASGAMNAAFEVKEKRSWLMLRVVALGLLLASGVLVLITVALSAAPSAVAGYGKEYVPSLPIPLWLITILFELLAILLNAALYMLIYRFLPSEQPAWRAAFTGGLTASILWEIAKKALASWLLRANHSLYGNLADLILFLLWIYYSMAILLIGAEVAAAHQKKRPGRLGADRATGRHRKRATLHGPH